MEKDLAIAERDFREARSLLVERWVRLDKLRSRLGMPSSIQSFADRRGEHDILVFHTPEDIQELMNLKGRKFRTKRSTYWEQEYKFDLDPLKEIEKFPALFLVSWDRDEDPEWGSVVHTAYFIPLREVIPE